MLIDMTFDGLFEWLRSVPDWGNVPSWFTFVAAISAAGFTGRNLLVALATRREDIEQKRQWQASSVAVWLTTAQNPDSVLTMCVNSSSVPVYDVTIWSRIDARVSPIVDIPVLGPSAEPQEIKDATDVFRAANPNEQLGILATLQRLGGLALAVQFRDATNVWWSRNFDGLLLEGRHPPGPTWREAQESEINRT